MSTNSPPVAPPLHPGEVDMALEELSPGHWPAVDSAATSLFQSPAHALYYSRRIGKRVRFHIDADGRITDPVVFELKRMWGLRCVEAFGPAIHRASVLASVMMRHRAPLCRAEVHGDGMVRDSDAVVIHPPVEVGCTMVVSLPATTDAYLKNLGSNMREQLPRFNRRVQREFGSDYECAVRWRQEIESNEVMELVELNRLRMEGKNHKQGGWDDSVRDDKLELAKLAGVLVVIKRQGKVVAGTLSYLHRKAAYLLLISHDPQYNKLKLGNVGLWQTIQTLIDAGYEKYDLLWGDVQYKSQFLGVRTPVQTYILSQGALARPIAAAGLLGRRVTVALRSKARAAYHSMRAARKPVVTSGEKESQA